MFRVTPFTEVLLSMVVLKEMRWKRLKTKYRRMFCLLLISCFVVLKILTKREISHTLCKCGVYTPYHLTAGGGEKVILSFVKVLQQITSCRIDLLVHKNNVCRNIRCLKQLATMLSVKDLRWDRVKFRIFSPEKLERERMLNIQYLIWVHMANSLLPSANAFGIFNVFHSQFPFDGLETPQNIHELEKLEKYQSVYLNSHYTLTWYEKFLERENKYYRAKRSNAFCYPGLTHFMPPLNYVDLAEKNKNSLQTRSGRNIILLGRFFEGIQSKQQLKSIEAFNKISKIRKDVKLFLYGFMATGQKRYVEEVRKAAQSNENVILKVGATSAEIEKAYQDSLIIWSITGLGSSTKSPADAEHFGIGLLDGMSRGIIPVVVNKGGPVEIVEGLSFKSTISSVEELVATTLNILGSDDETLQSMRKEVADLADIHMTRGRFETNFESLFSILGMKLAPGKEVLWQKFVLVMKKTELKHCKSELILPKNATKVALYVENRHDSSLRANVLRLMNTLGPSWGLHVIHSSLNEHYLKSLLKNVQNVRFQNMQEIVAKLSFSRDETSEGIENTLDPRSSDGMYNPMWKSLAFWEALDDVEKVFTFQSDSWFVGNMEQSIESYDYVGSPWCLEGNAGFLSIQDRPQSLWHMLHETRKIDSKFRVGNGGISLRSLPAVKSIISQHRKSSAPQENEDVFFVHYLNKDGYRIADKTVASTFGLECFCADIAMHRELVDLWFWLLERNRNNKDFSMERLSDHVLFMHKPEIVYMQLANKYLDSLHPWDLDENLHVEMIDTFEKFFMN